MGEPSPQPPDLFAHPVAPFPVFATQKQVKCVLIYPVRFFSPPALSEFLDFALILS